MSEAALAPFGCIEDLNGFPLHGLMSGDHHLGNAFPIIDDKVIL